MPGRRRREERLDLKEDPSDRISTFQCKSWSVLTLTRRLPSCPPPSYLERESEGKAGRMPLAWITKPDTVVRARLCIDLSLFHTLRDSFHSCYPWGFSKRKSKLTGAIWSVRSTYRYLLYMKTQRKLS